MGANSSRKRACPRLTLPGARDMRNAKTEPCMQLAGPLIPQQHCIPAPRRRWSLFGPFSEPGLACLATEPRGRRRKASRLLVINFAPGFVGWDPFFVPRLLCRGCDQPRCPPVLDLLDPWNLRLTTPAQTKKTESGQQQHTLGSERGYFTEVRIQESSTVATKRCSWRRTRNPTRRAEQANNMFHQGRGSISPSAC